MLTIIVLIFMIAIFGNLIGVAIQMAWGLAKVLVTLVFLPLLILGFLFSGLFYIAIPILAIVGLVSVIKAIA